MAANQFYPFATAGGAFVLNNAAYLALAARSTGYPAGILAKEALNSAIRQAAFVAATVSQLVADNQPLAVNDDGVVANYENRLTVALRNLTGSDSYLLDTGAVNAYVVTFAPAQTALVNGQFLTFKAVATNTGAATLNAGPGAIALTRNDGGALAPGDVPAGSLVSVRYDLASAVWRITGVVLSQLASLGAARYLTAAATLVPGVYGVNSQAGPFSVNLPAGPLVGAQITIVDLGQALDVNPMTIARNGQTIMGNALDIIADAPDSQFTIWFNGTTWSLS